MAALEICLPQGFPKQPQLRPVLQGKPLLPVGYPLLIVREELHQPILSALSKTMRNHAFPNEILLLL